MTRRSVPSLIVAMVCLAALPAHGQDANSADPPAHISFVDGSAVLERDGELDAAPSSMPLLAGDRVRTRDGRVEVLFADGSALHLDADTIVDFQSDDVVRLLNGRIRLSIAGHARDVAYRVDAPAAWVQISEPGEYRVAVLGEADVELAVLRGAAELVNEQGRTHIRAGERTFARAGAAPSSPYVFNSAAWDGFDRWSEDRRSQRLGASAQYLPGDVRPYAATFDSHGSWRHEQPHGYVWYPRVDAGWRPYHRGRWASLRPYGWTWIAADPWGWPTHHYGRWGVSAGAWYWIPGRHWGPAWVSWAYATNYVSWCPLGWNNRPVFQIVSVNVFGGRRYSPWDGWTVVPRRHFSRPFVHVASLASVRIDQRLHRSFVVHDRAPEFRHGAGRSAVPIRSAGRFAVPRSGPGRASPGEDPGRRAGAARSATAAGAERRFPAPARAPGEATVLRGTGQARSSSGPRAVSREPTAGAQPGGETPARRTGAATASGNAAREPRRAPESVASRPSSGRVDNRSVTPAPAGAVPAAPRSRPATVLQRTGPATASPSGPRAVSREPAARAQPGAETPARRTGAATASGTAAREPRRSPETVGSRPPSGRVQNRSAVTPAPAGTVHAQPRPRPSGDAAPSSRPAGPARRTAVQPARPRSSAAPGGTAPAPIAAPPPQQRAPAGGGVRSSPVSPRAPGAAPGYRSRPAPSPGPSAPAAPTYRSAPARQAPAARAPAAPAARPTPRSSGASSPAASGSSRRGSDEAASSGPRTRRRE